MSSFHPFPFNISTAFFQRSPDGTVSVYIEPNPSKLLYYYEPEPPPIYLTELQFKTIYALLIYVSLDKIDHRPYIITNSTTKTYPEYRIRPVETPDNVLDEARFDAALISQLRPVVTVEDVLDEERLDAAVISQIVAVYTNYPNPNIRLPVRELFEDFYAPMSRLMTEEWRRDVETQSAKWVEVVSIAFARWYEAGG